MHLVHKFASEIHTYDNCYFRCVVLYHFAYVAGSQSMNNTAGHRIWYNLDRFWNDKSRSRAKLLRFGFSVQWSLTWVDNKSGKRHCLWTVCFNMVWFREKKKVLIFICTFCRFLNKWLEYIDPKKTRENVKINLWYENDNSGESKC